jgi:hypothetical protein
MSLDCAKLTDSDSARSSSENSFKQLLLQRSPYHTGSRQNKKTEKRRSPTPTVAKKHQDVLQFGIQD